MRTDGLSDEAKATLKDVLSLSDRGRVQLLRKLGVKDSYPTLPIRHKQFVDRMMVSMEPRRAEREAGYPKGVGALRSDPKVGRAIVEKMAELEERTELTAEFVRKYIYTVMTFCPGDFFRPGPNGVGWVIDDTGYETLPREVRMLVESMVLIDFHGSKYLAVTFISKTAALSLAAKYTMAQQVNVGVTQVPWDKLIKEMEGEVPDVIERRLQSMELNGRQHGE